MILDKYIEKTIGGKVYRFALPIKYVFKAERELVNRNLVTTMANYPLSIEDTFTLFKYSLMGGGQEKANAENLFYDAIDELTLPVVCELILEVLQKSGVFGKSKKA